MNQKVKILGVIPARYASTRFPAKALADLGGKSLIQRVYEQSVKAKCLTEVIVATDNQEILNHVQAFGGNACMTREDHASGTDRCFEALTLSGSTYDYVINIQGDEPFIQPEQIDLLGAQLNGETEIATLIKVIDEPDQLFDPSEAKVTIATDKSALYFSRSVIPYRVNVKKEESLTNFTYYKHIGMYGYRSDILQKLVTLEVSSLEKAESLEQLRWMENGFRITTVETDQETVGIDTPEDLKRALTYLNAK